MAYCNQCGSEVASSKTYCEECGAKVYNANEANAVKGEYSSKSRIVAILLAVLLGIFGIHKFYLGNTKKGIIYLVFSWTGIPALLGFYDAFKYYTNEQKFQKSYEASAADSGSSTGSNTDSNTGQKNVTSKPDDAVKHAEGVNGGVTLYVDRIEISRDDIGMLHKMQHGFKGDKEIPLDSITSVQLRKPSTVTRGYIQLGQSGYHGSDDGLMDATTDENTVLFEKDSLTEFQELREKVRELSKQEVKSSTGDIDDAMQKLRERYADGEIDEEEFENRKEVLDSS